MTQKNSLIAFAVPVVAGIVILMSAYLIFRQSRFSQGTVTLGDDIKVKVDIANTDRTRERGLSGREGLREGEGMLFLFPEASRYGFWMKEMRFPIDIVWIRKGEVVDFTTDVPPPSPGQTELPSYFPISAVDAVLEVQAGFAQRNGLRAGMAVDFQH
jgi:uncharacterized membrane protein (UPF0127 family)